MRNTKISNNVFQSMESNLKNSNIFKTAASVEAEMVDENKLEVIASDLLQISEILDQFDLEVLSARAALAADNMWEEKLHKTAFAGESAEVKEECAKWMKEALKKEPGLYKTHEKLATDCCKALDLEPGHLELALSVAKDVMSGDKNDASHEDLVEKPEDINLTHETPCSHEWDQFDEGILRCKLCGQLKEEVQDTNDVDPGDIFATEKALGLGEPEVVNPQTLEEKIEDLETDPSLLEFEALSPEERKELDKARLEMYKEQKISEELAKLEELVPELVETEGELIHSDEDVEDAHDGCPCVECDKDCDHGHCPKCCKEDSCMAKDGGYNFCKCRDCPEIVVGDDFCAYCEEAACEEDEECKSASAYGMYEEDIAEKDLDEDTLGFPLKKKDKLEADDSCMACGAMMLDDNCADCMMINDEEDAAYFLGIKDNLLDNPKKFEMVLGDPVWKGMGDLPQDWTLEKIKEKAEAYLAGWEEAEKHQNEDISDIRLDPEGAPESIKLQEAEKELMEMLEKMQGLDDDEKEALHQTEMAYSKRHPDTEFDLEEINLEPENELEALHIDPLPPLPELEMEQKRYEVPGHEFKPSFHETVAPIKMKKAMDDLDAWMNKISKTKYFEADEDNKDIDHFEDFEDEE